MFIAILLSLSIPLFLGAGVLFVYGLVNMGCAFIAFGAATTVALIAYMFAMLIDKLGEERKK